MAFANVIYFGRDDCQRIQALRHAGYDVRESDSLDRLRLHLVGKHDVDAVIVSESEPRRAEQAAHLVRMHTGAPLILFRLPHVVLDESKFDRVYFQPVPPANWLFDTAVVVMQSKELRAQSEELRRAAEAVLEESGRQVARALDLTRKLPPAWPEPEDVSA